MGGAPSHHKTKERDIPFGERERDALKNTARSDFAFNKKGQNAKKREHTQNSTGSPRTGVQATLICAVL